MKNKWKIFGGILLMSFLVGLCFFFTPVDIRPDHLQRPLQASDKIKGELLLKEMQEAYGGKELWLAFKEGSYVQTADWYDDPFGVSGWDELEQEFAMTSTLGTDNSELTLLNGSNHGQTWGVEDGRSYQVQNGQQVFIENEKYHHKLIYKNYWFQFPFRIGEAPIIAYAGESQLKGKTYELLYVTWGNEAPNRQYDQYLLYLNQETKMIEWLHFTLRDKLNFLHLSAQFTDFKPINGIMAPFTQYITLWSPESGGQKMHENRYQWIQFGETKVLRSSTSQ